MTRDRPAVDYASPGALSCRQRDEPESAPTKPRPTRHADVFLCRVLRDPADDGARTIAGSYRLAVVWMNDKTRGST